MTARRPRDPRLVPITETRHYASFRTGKRECWGAKTTDGQWTFEREESSGTPWLIYHQPSVDDDTYPKPIQMLGTRRACQLFVGCGLAATTLAMLKCSHPADQRGHRVERGTFDWHYEVCKPCGAFRCQHDDDDGCHTCQKYEAGDGPGHEWNPAEPPAMEQAS